MKQSVMDQVVRVSRSFHPGTHLASLCVDVPRARAASLVLRALAGEAAAASKQTTPGLAAIRLGFWRQSATAAIEGGGGGGGGDRAGAGIGDGSSAPVILALRALGAEALIGDTALNRRRLRQIVENAARCSARGAVLDASGDSAQMYVQRMSDMEAMAEGVDGNILHLTNTVARAAAGAEAEGVDEFEHAASHVGKAVGIVRMIHNSPMLASERRAVLPMELCLKFGLVMEDLFRGNTSERLRDTVHAVASVAHGHLAQARDARHIREHKIPVAGRRILLPAVVAQEYLDLLERREFDIFHPDVQNVDAGGLGQLRLQMLLSYSSMLGKY